MTLSARPEHCSPVQCCPDVPTAPTWNYRIEMRVLSTGYIANILLIFSGGRVEPCCYVTLAGRPEHCSQILPGRAPTWNYRVETRVDQAYILDPRYYMFLYIMHESISILRDQGNIVLFNHPSLSRHHCQSSLYLWVVKRGKMSNLNQGYKNVGVGGG